MSGIFGGSAAAPIIQNPARPAPLPKTDTGANVLLGTDALDALNKRTKKRPKSATPQGGENQSELGGVASPGGTGLGGFSVSTVSV